MPEEISSPERHRPTACPVRRRLGGSSFLRMTGLGEPAKWHKRTVAIQVHRDSPARSASLCGPLTLLRASAVIPPFWLRLCRAGPLRSSESSPSKSCGLKQEMVRLQCRGAEKSERAAARPKAAATARSGPDWRFLTASSEGGASRRKISVDLNCHGALVPFGGFPSSSLRERG